jgi:AAA lid domain
MDLQVSDRRWRKIVALMETAAAAQSRFEIFDFDFCNITQCIWSDIGDIASIEDWFKQKLSKKGTIDSHRDFLHALEKNPASDKKKARDIMARCDEHIEEIDSEIALYEVKIAVRKEFINADLFLSQSWKADLLDLIELLPTELAGIRDEYVYLKLKTGKSSVAVDEA